ncbi:hypothetical protein [Paenibacillus naphthalenovorans]|uniref:Uncharacterized protein n=1 Tax=Paenibacillus naphthalenovorans TaxID=162209 RepID=A0A0U2M413_9BACL|nr:hypothetical protein [Paenibacillus naphthalenovorans]ALS22240.1 hypothetical protein IJ22_18660 [Paenibacillus naphthalenovorans]
MNKEQMKELIYNNIPENDYQVLNCSIYYKAMKDDENTFKQALNELIRENKVHMDAEIEGVKLYRKKYPLTKKCQGTCNNYFDKKCKGEVLTYRIISPENHKYPNRDWGLNNYCLTAKENDERNGFVVTEIEDQLTTV